MSVKNGGGEVGGVGEFDTLSSFFSVRSAALTVKN